MKPDRAESRDRYAPCFPVIYKEPTFKQVRDNIRQEDYIQAAIFSLISFPLGYIVARKVDTKFAHPGMWFTGIITALGCAAVAYENTSLRLRGYGPNDEEVIRYQSVVREK